MAIEHDPSAELKPDAPQRKGMMINYRELRAPDTATTRRGVARGVPLPDLTVIPVHNGKDLVVCPTCRGHRPQQCITLAKRGWMCDGCISDERRRGVFEEHDAATLAALEEKRPVVEIPPRA